MRVGGAAPSSTTDYVLRPGLKRWLANAVTGDHGAVRSSCISNPRSLPVWSGEEHEVGVSLDVQNVASVKTGEQTFSVLASLKVCWRDPELLRLHDVHRDSRVSADTVRNKPEVAFLKQRGDVTILSEEVVVRPKHAVVLWRRLVEVTVFDPVNARAFPYDIQDMKIGLRLVPDLERMGRYFVLYEEVAEELDEVGLPRFLPTIRLTNVMVPEFHILAPEVPGCTAEASSAKRWMLTTIDRRVDENASFSCTFWVQRLPLYYSLNVLSMTTFIEVLALPTFGIPADELADRLSFNIGLLLAAIALKFAFADAIPKLPYITLLDFKVYFSFFSIFAIMLVQWAQVEFDLEAANLIIGAAYAGCVLLTEVVCFILIWACAGERPSMFLAGQMAAAPDDPKDGPRFALLHEEDAIVLSRRPFTAAEYEQHKSDADAPFRTRKGSWLSQDLFVSPSEDEQSTLLIKCTRFEALSLTVKGRIGRAGALRLGSTFKANPEWISLEWRTETGARDLSIYEHEVFDYKMVHYELGEDKWYLLWAYDRFTDRESQLALAGGYTYDGRWLDDEYFAAEQDGGLWIARFFDRGLYAKYIHDGHASDETIRHELKEPACFEEFFSADVNVKMEHCLGPRGRFIGRLWGNFHSSGAENFKMVRFDHIFWARDIFSAREAGLPHFLDRFADPTCYRGKWLSDNVFAGDADASNPDDTWRWFALFTKDGAYTRGEAEVTDEMILEQCSDLEYVKKTFLLETFTDVKKPGTTGQDQWTERIFRHESRSPFIGKLFAEHKRGHGGLP
mmetsp:Transcript_18403/g.69614  ORF Transcript_18403/g.69614 Transcript_18403/m.69614 type:complete len:790 (-) Transcript_18403:352-2721(-)